MICSSSCRCRRCNVWRRWWSVGTVYCGPSGWYHSRQRCRRCTRWRGCGSRKTSSCHWIQSGPPKCTFGRRTFGAPSISVWRRVTSVEAGILERINQPIESVESISSCRCLSHMFCRCVSVPFSLLGTTVFEPNLVCNETIGVQKKRTSD